MPRYDSEALRLSQLGRRMTHGLSRIDKVTLADKGAEVWSTVHGHHIDPQTGLAEKWRTTVTAPAAISGALIDVIEGCIRNHDADPSDSPEAHPMAAAGHLSDFAVTKNGDVWTGCFSIATDVGPIRVCASADDAAIRTIVRQRMAAQTPAAAAGAGFDFFRAISDVTQEIARGRILERVASAFREVAANPVVSQLAGLARSIPIFGPILDASGRALQGGADLLAQSQRPGGVQPSDLMSAFSRAISGSEEERRAIQVIAGMDGGWLWLKDQLNVHRPMRPASAIFDTRTALMTADAAMRRRNRLPRPN